MGYDIVNPVSYESGVYLRSGDNGSWIDFNDTNHIYRRKTDNSGWVDGSHQYGPKVFKRTHNNDGWIQLYPKGVVNVDPPPVVSDSVNGSFGYYQEKYTYWTKDSARQGWCTKSNAGGRQFGLIMLPGSRLPGSGSIIDPGTITFSGSTGGSGNYNNYQTISFRGCTHPNFNTLRPIGSHDPNTPFTFSWQSRGAYTDIPEGNVNVSGAARDTVLRWMNNINGYGTNLCTFNGETGSGIGWSANYLSITRLRLNVKGLSYQVRSMMFDRPEGRPRFYSFAAVQPPKDDNYLSLVVPAHVNIDNAHDAVRMVENGEIEHFSENDVTPLFETDIKPTIMALENNLIKVSHIDTQYTNVQYETGDHLWHDAICVNPMIYKIPENAKQVRIYEKRKDEVYSTMKLK